MGVQSKRMQDEQLSVLAAVEFRVCQTREM